MTQQLEDNHINQLLRAAALIELEDCLEQALSDMQTVWLENEQLVREWFDLPDAGEFVLVERGVCYQSAEHTIFLKPEKVRLRMNRIQPDWFRLHKLLGFD